MMRRSDNLRKHASLLWRALNLTLREPRSTLQLLRLAFWVAVVSFLVKHLPLLRALQLVSPHRKRLPRGLMIGDETLSPGQLAAQLDKLLGIDFWVFTPTCWKRAAVLHRLLALDGIETRIVFGVRKDGGDMLSGHSWLEANGRPFLEAHPPSYAAVFIFPAPLKSQ